MLARPLSFLGRTPFATSAQLALVVAALGAGGTASGQLCPGGFAGPAPFPLKPGMSVVTQNDPFNQSYVLATFDLREAPCYGTLGGNWCPPRYTGPNNSWTRANLGEIFGVEIDDATPPDIFVTASNLHGANVFGPGGAGGVYRIDGITGSINALPSINIGTPSLGDITYDPQTQRLFVSDFDEGLIHSFFRNGTGVKTYDHGLSGEPKIGAPAIADNGDPSFTPYGRRVWALAAHGDRLYYSVWNKDSTTQLGARDNEIWSVRLSPGAGLFDVSDIRRELVVPKLPGATYSNPVTSIEFANDGRMILAERGCTSVAQAAPHQARVLEYVPAANGWVPSGSNFGVGFYTVHQNAAGGVAFDDCTFTDYFVCLSWQDRQQQAIWATGDALADLSGGTGSLDVYGLQRIHQLGNTSATVQSDSYFVDLNGTPGWQDKTSPHDMDVMVACEESPCSFEVESVDCFFEGEGVTGYYTVTVKATNGSASLFATTLNLNGTMIPIALGPGQSATHSTVVQSAQSQAWVYMDLRDSWGNVICGEKLLFDVPDCTCFELESEDVEFSSSSGSLLSDTVSATLHLQNFASWPVKWVTIIPLTPGFGSPNPSVVTFPTPVAPGGTFSIHFDASSPFVWFVPGPCYQVILHDPSFKDCCSKTWCFSPTWGDGDFGDLFGDIDGDGDVAAPDLGSFLSMWGSATPVGDFDSDGEVGSADLSILLANWGSGG